MPTWAYFLTAFSKALFLKGNLATRYVLTQSVRFDPEFLRFKWFGYF